MIFINLYNGSKVAPASKMIFYSQRAGSIRIRAVFGIGEVGLVKMLFYEACALSKNVTWFNEPDISLQFVTDFQHL